VTAKAKAPLKQTVASVVRSTRTAPNPAEAEKTPQSTLLTPEAPLFDDAVAGISDSECFVCVPGVTFS
jgi:hypothetical protein